MQTKRFCIEMPLPQRPAMRRREIATRAQSIGPQRAAFFTKKLWPNGKTLRVRFLGGTKAQQEFVKKVAVEWCKYANLKFDFLTKPAASDIRISFKEGEGSYSYVGTDCRSIPQSAETMNLGWLDPKNPDDAGTVLHEFGHAIGLQHEHMRPGLGEFKWNRQAVIDDLSGAPNYWTVEQIEENVLNKLMAKDLTATATIDRTSIMEYMFPASWTLDGAGAPQNDQLSKDDKALCMRVYPKTTTTKPARTEEGEEEDDDPDANLNEEEEAGEVGGEEVVGEGGAGEGSKPDEKPCKKCWAFLK